MTSCFEIDSGKTICSVSPVLPVANRRSIRSGSKVKPTMVFVARYVLGRAISMRSMLPGATRLPTYGQRSKSGLQKPESFVVASAARLSVMPVRYSVATSVLRLTRLSQMTFPSVSMRSDAYGFFRTTTG